MILRHAVLAGLIGVASVARAVETNVPVPSSAAGGDESRSAAAQPASSLFDPVRHMRVADVKPGMKGHGLSVFSGTEIERFEVEVISVLKNFNPKGDVILIKCRGKNLEHTGAVAGMSGSPIYLKGDDGRERMIGAFAYGWPLSKDPIAGVQPIEYMLEIPTGSTPPRPNGNGKPVAGDPAAPAQKPTGAEPRGQWSIQQALANWDRYTHPGQSGARPLASSGINSPIAKTQADAVRLEPLATPLMTSGVSTKVLDQFGPLFTAQGLTPLQSGGAGKMPEGIAQPKIEPGSVLAVPLVVGDMDMTAIGTATEVLKGQVFGFGHPFQNEGQVTLPMGAGYINHIVATLSTSFKLGSMSAPAGTIGADRSVGIAGRMGEAPPMAPIDLRVVYADGSVDTKYHFESVMHPRFTPLLCGMAVTSALSGVSELPQYNTVDYDISLQFSNGKTLKLSDTLANAAGQDIFRFIGMPLLTASDNPFDRVLVTSVTGTVRVSNEPRLAAITEVNLPRSKYRPGELLKAFVEYKRFRGGEGILPVELELPKDLAEGNYQLVISDWTRYMQDEQTSKPFRFTAETTDELFDALRDFTSVRQNAVYLRLIRQPDGVAIGRTALSKLPGSRRQMLLGAGRSNTTKFVSSATRTVPTETVMQGAAEFVINIDEDATVDDDGAKSDAPPPPTAPPGSTPEGKAPSVKTEPAPMPPTAPKPAPMPPDPAPMK
jgi:hypothetical protein